MMKLVLAPIASLLLLLSSFLAAAPRGSELPRCRCCQPPSGQKLLVLPMERRSSSLLDRTLRDEHILVLAARADLLRWDRPARLRFRLWFGTEHPLARRYLFRTVSRIALLSTRYQQGNFAAASPSRPGVVAYVYPDEPGHIFLDREFFTRHGRGLDSRAGTLVHEMSHFKIIAGTQDHVYGTRNALQLARQDPMKALTNADNIEFYCEFVARQRFHFKQAMKQSSEESLGWNHPPRRVQAGAAVSSPCELVDSSLPFEEAAEDLEALLPNHRSLREIDLLESHLGRIDTWDESWLQGPMSPAAP